LNTIRRALAHCADFRLEKLGEESLISGEAQNDHFIFRNNPRVSFNKV
jgi:hypothetical protein